MHVEQKMCKKSRNNLNDPIVTYMLPPNIQVAKAQSRYLWHANNQSILNIHYMWGSVVNPVSQYNCTRPAQQYKQSGFSKAKTGIPIIRWRSQWPRGLRHELSSLARNEGIPLEASMSVWVYSVSVLGSGLAKGWSLVQGVVPNVLD
jgi:hypothetical protein